MNEPRLSFTWILVLIAAAAVVAVLARVPDFRRHVLDAAGRRVEVRHA